MNLADLIDLETVVALEPDELGLIILKPLAVWPQYGADLALPTFLNAVDEGYGVRREDVRQSLREAWAWLEGQALLLPDSRFSGSHLMRVLSRRARRLAREQDPRRTFTARQLPKDSLHPRLCEDVWALYHRGKYESAVFEAMKAVEVAVREAAKLSLRDLGTDLMRKAFHAETGPLTDLEAEKSEREARAHLFAGAIGAYKNPHSHRNVVLDDPQEAAEVIGLASLLLRLVDGAATRESK